MAASLPDDPKALPAGAVAVLIAAAFAAGYLGTALLDRPSRPTRERVPAKGAPGRPAGADAADPSGPGAGAFSPTPPAPGGPPPEGLLEVPIRVRVPLLPGPWRGAPSEQALVTIVEFIDFQSVLTRIANDGVLELLRRHRGELRWQVRHLPRSPEPAARPAAIAAVAAHLQGKYWDMHEVLFRQRPLLQMARLGDAGRLPDLLDGYARDAGCEAERWRAARASAEPERLVSEDEGVAASLGVAEVPFFFVNGRPLSSFRIAERLAPVVEEELELARRTISTQRLSAPALAEHLLRDALPRLPEGRSRF